MEQPTDSVRNSALATMAPRAVLWASAGASCILGFVWPLAVSTDPDQPAFRVAAVFTLLAFLSSIVVVLAGRLAGKR